MKLAQPAEPWLARHLQAVSDLSVAELMDQRYTKFRRMGEVGIVDTAGDAETAVNEAGATR
jgi:acetyl-CoA carboxylase alpha subunit